MPFENIQQHFIIHFAAPGTYSPERINMSKSPQYSFGVKTELCEKNAVPGGFNYHYYYSELFPCINIPT